MKNDIKMIINRELKLDAHESCFLFGPRGTGKSTLLEQYFNKDSALWIDLLRASEEEKYARNPDTLIAEVAALSDVKTHIVIDEIQKVPRLLDVVHHLIEHTQKYFVLSGSSTRKIKNNAANLLAGRAFVYHLAPFTFTELGKKFQLENALNWGMLPKIYQYQHDSQKKKFLQAYARTYLKEEVWLEQLIRNLYPFRYFLEVAAQGNGKIINYSNIARDVGVDYKTVENYYSILEDTLLGFFVHAYSGSFRKQINQAPKFYFFDVGVTRSLARMLSVLPREKTNYYGDLFEHFIIIEIKKLIEYHQNEYRLSYLRTKTGLELDLIIDRPQQKKLLIEIKSNHDVQEHQLSNFSHLIEEFPDCEAVCFSRDTHQKKFGKIMVWPWQEGIGHFFK